MDDSQERKNLISSSSVFDSVADPFGEIDNVQESYQPPSTSIAPSNAWQEHGTAGGKQASDLLGMDVQASQGRVHVSQEVVEDDEPFTSAHLGVENDVKVPAIVADGKNAGLYTGKPVPLEPENSGQVGEISRQGEPKSAAGRTTGFGGAQSERLVPEAFPMSDAGVQESVEDASSYPFYSIKRYRKYFNVSTENVLERMYRSVVLFYKGDFLDHTDGNPDLYGPFWIASTLIFVSAAAGNTASYIAYHRKHTDAGAGWYYDVDKVGGSMGLFYGYVGVLGLILYAVLRYFKAGLSLASVWCTYGYALVAYIPMAALCALPFEIARWILVGVATLVSGIFLVRNFQSRVFESAGMHASIILLAVAILHAALGLSLKFYFFNY